MKKIILVLACFLSSVMMFGQAYMSKSYVAETGNSLYGKQKACMLAKGKSSNSTAPDSCANVYVFFSENYAWMSFFAYSPSYEAKAFNVVFHGNETNTEITTTSENLSFEFLKMCESNDTIDVKMTETNSFFEPVTAHFILYDCKQFNKMFMKMIVEK